jgi:hypothetical protein
MGGVKRTMPTVAFSTLFRLFSDLRLAVAPEEVSWGGSFLSGFARLPVLF